MKKKLVFLFFIVIAVSMADVTLLGMPQGGVGDDDWGKLIGRVVDPYSGRNANEKFEIQLLTLDELKDGHHHYRGYTTDEYGTLSVKLPSGIYYLVFRPKELDTRYSFEPLPRRNEKYVFKVKIEPGKITEFVKTATVGGSIKIKLKDPDGRLVEPEKAFDGNVKISVSLDSPDIDLPIYASMRTKDNLDDGEMLVSGIFPGIYSVKVSYSGIAYPTFRKNNVEIRKSETTEVEVVIDPFDSTGLEGKVLNQYGEIIKKAVVKLFPVFPVYEKFEGYSDSGGRFRLTGLPAGKYEIGVRVKSTIYYLKEEVEIKKNVLLKKDITVNVD